MPQYGPGGGYGWPEQPPQSLQDYYASIEQGSNRRFDLTLGESRAARQADLKAKMAQIDMQYKIAKLNAQTEGERLEVDRWYKQQQTRIADETLKENVRQFDKQYGLNEADLTGFYGGNPTLARDKWQADATGYVGDRETLQREELRRRFGLDERRFGLEERTADRRFGLDEGSLTGEYGGRQTLEAQELARRFGLDTQKFGLNVAQTAADLRSRPDMLFQYQQFAQSLPGLLAGQGGQLPAAGTGPQGQTIAGQLAEVGYLGAANPGSPTAGGTGAYGNAMSMQLDGSFQPMGAGWGTTGQPSPQGPTAGSLSPQEQARYQQLVARRAQLAAAGAGDVSPQDLAELQRYQARSGPGTPAPAASRYAGGIPNMGSEPGSYMQLQGGGGLDPSTAAPTGNPYAARQAAASGTPAAMGYLSYAAPDLSSDPTLQALGKTYQSGFRKLGAQSLEGMDENEAGFLSSAGTYLGYDPKREVRSYQRSRLGQSVGGGY